MTELVGIVNVTPDSFSDGGKYFDPSIALEHGEQLLQEGASYLDVGAESTRPGATPITAEEERRRLEPLINAQVPLFHAHVSIDTYRPETIRWIAEEIGPVIVNDVTGFNNPAMIEVAAEFDLTCIVSHLPAAYGQNIQAAHTAEHKIDSLDQVTHELMGRRMEMIEAGIDAGKIILDPGIGFGKTMRLNWQLLTFAKQVPDIPVMVGYSNKRFLCSDPETGRLLPNAEALRADQAWLDAQNLLAGKIAIEHRAGLLRVHDVALHSSLLTS